MNFQKLALVMTAFLFCASSTTALAQQVPHEPVMMSDSYGRLPAHPIPQPITPASIIDGTLLVPEITIVGTIPKSVHAEKSEQQYWKTLTLENKEQAVKVALARGMTLGQYLKTIIAAKSTKFEAVAKEQAMTAASDPKSDPRVEDAVTEGKPYVHTPDQQKVKVRGDGTAVVPGQSLGYVPRMPLPM